MKSLLRRRPSPAMIVALIALFVSLSGVSYGVATGFIDSREIKNNEVRSIDIRNNEIRTRDLRNNEVRGIDIRNSTVQGRDIALNTVTGEDVKEDTPPEGAERPARGLGNDSAPDAVATLDARSRVRCATRATPGCRHSATHRAVHAQCAAACRTRRPRQCADHARDDGGQQRRAMRATVPIGRRLTTARAIGPDDGSSRTRGDQPNSHADGLDVRELRPCATSAVALSARAASRLHRPDRLIVTGSARHEHSCTARRAPGPARARPRRRPAGSSGAA